MEHAEPLMVRRSVETGQKEAAARCTDGVVIRKSCYQTQALEACIETLIRVFQYCSLW